MNASNINIFFFFLPIETDFRPIWAYLYGLVSLNQVVAVPEQKVSNEMLFSTWMHQISIAFSYFYQLKLILDQ
jgi:hypothetical protein